MMPPFAERRVWVGDPVRYAALTLYAKKLMRHEQDGEDLCNGSLEVATRVMERGKGPETEADFAKWVFGVVKTLARAMKRQQRSAKWTESLEEHADLAAEDTWEVLATRAEFERKLEALEGAIAANPDKAARLVVRGANDTAARPAPLTDAQRKGRQDANKFFRTAVTAAVAALAVLLFIRTRPRTFGLERTDILANARPSDTQVAARLRELALAQCVTSQWRACLAELNDARKLDPEGDHAPLIVQARTRAETAIGGPLVPLPVAPNLDKAAASRREGLAECKAKHWLRCLMALDTASVYDPEGDETSEVSAARGQAVEGLYNPALFGDPVQAPEQFDSKDPGHRLEQMREAGVAP